MVLHPDFNVANGHHTDVEFKPAIARYDWDQTYDVLEFVYLPQGFSQLMDLCGIPAFELMAIDRFTPYRYRWAEQYSDVVYEFLKAFNFSPHSSINKRLLSDENGVILNFELHPLYRGFLLPNTHYVVDDVVWAVDNWWQCTKTHINDDPNDILVWNNWKPLSFNNNITNITKFEYTRFFTENGLYEYFLALRDNPQNLQDWVKISYVIPAFEFVGNYVSETEIKATFSKGQYIVTALVAQGGEGLTGSIATVNQVFYRFNVCKDNEEIDLNKLINLWSQESIYCSCSMVISKNNSGTWEEYNPTFSNKPNWLLYQNILDYFNNIKNQLLNYFNDIFNDFSLTVQEIIYWQKSYDLWSSYKEKFSIPTNINLPQSYLKTVIGQVTPTPNLTKSQEEVLTPLTTEYDYFPSYMTNYCYLVFANNNKWESNKTLTLIDKGVKPLNYFNYSLYSSFYITKLQELYTLNNQEFQLYRTKSNLNTSAYFTGNPLPSNYYVLDPSKYNLYFKPTDYFLLDFSKNNNREIYDQLLPYTGTPPDPTKLLQDNVFFISFCAGKITISNPNNNERIREIILSPFTGAIDNAINTVAFLPVGVSIDLLGVKWINRNPDPFKKGYAKKMIIDVSGFGCQGKIDYGFVTKIDPFTQNLVFDPTNSFTLMNEVKNELVLLSEDEFMELKDINSLTDQEYLDYLLQLKEQYEEMSKTW